MDNQVSSEKNGTRDHWELMFDLYSFDVAVRIDDWTKIFDEIEDVLCWSTFDDQLNLFVCLLRRSIFYENPPSDFLIRRSHSCVKLWYCLSRCVFFYSIVEIFSSINQSINWRRSAPVYWWTSMAYCAVTELFVRYVPYLFHRDVHLIRMWKENE